MATASGLAYHIDRLWTRSGVTLALAVLVIGIALSIAVIVIVGLLQPPLEPVVVAPLRWYS